MKPFIVKVQTSLESSDNHRRVLVYNESRTVQFQCLVKDVPGLKLLMRGRPKMYVHAELVGTVIDLGSEAPEQNW